MLLFNALIDKFGCNHSTLYLQRNCDMMDSIICVNPNLQKYIEDSIICQYNVLDRGHNEMHIYYVIKRSLEISRLYGADINMSYTIAAYHDIGMLEDRSRHEIISGNILLKDNCLKQWFSEEKILIMKEAVEEHRASYKYEPKTIYGKIISQADRNFDIRIIVCRAIEYGKKFYPNYNLRQHFDRVYDYIEKKYGYNGYMNLWLDFQEDSQKLDEVRRIIYTEKERLINMCKAFLENNTSECYNLMY